MPMPIDGLRAWIGEVERKLGMRTRVFLVLTAIAVGVGGAAMYLALDMRSDAVTESDVQELQERLEGGVVGGVGTDTTQLEAELRALQAEVEELRGGPGGGGQGGQGGAQGGQGGGAGNGGGTGGGAGTGGDDAQLQDLLEEAQRRSEGGN